LFTPPRVASASCIAAKKAQPLRRGHASSG
jgi:hypothetical protein